MDRLIKLYATLHERYRPEDIAQMISEILNDSLTRKEHTILEKAAKGSLVRNFVGYTSMLQTFAQVVNAEKQINKAIEIFKLQYTQNPNPEHLEDFIEDVSAIIQKPLGYNDFKTDRLNKTQRKESGLDISKRSYNKKWRLVKRLEKKLLTIAREKRKREFQMVSKHGLAHHIELENFSTDENTACFIAYYNARCNVRTEFTIDRQQRAFDEISEMLLVRCKKETASWWAIAHIYPNQDVLFHLRDEQKGILLGRWTNILQDIASLLSEVWNSNNIHKESMVVKKGNDSTTWNNTAGAWNKARDHWINIIYATGMESILDELCFGKVLRLMAADVVAWHRLSGGDLDFDTSVWNELPFPWEVFEGKASCNRHLITRICRKAGLDAEKSGWIAPRIQRIAAFKPTPELVHGVAVSNPFLAIVLKKHQYFSGKETKPFFPENN